MPVKPPPHITKPIIRLLANNLLTADAASASDNNLMLYRIPQQARDPFSQLLMQVF
ncbi:MAG: hypothetical protein ABW104_08800 [Candidatus Thiodiazotropha sp. 6PLUC2]